MIRTSVQPLSLDYPSQLPSGGDACIQDIRDRERRISSSAARNDRTSSDGVDRYDRRLGCVGR